MRILVTGGAGYVGSAAVRYLLEADHSVVVLDDLRDGCAACVPPEVEFAVGDVADEGVLERLIPGCDAVVHCAGMRPADGGLADPGVVLSDNTAGPLSLLRAMAAEGVDQLVWTSCAAVYGEPDVVPIVEGAMTSPLAPFGESKMMFERMTGWFGHPFGLRTVTLRLFDVAGAWPDGTTGEVHDFQGHLIPRVLTALAEGEPSIDVLGGYPTPDGTPIRDYVHMHDVARAVALSLDWLGGGGQGGIVQRLLSAWSLGGGGRRGLLRGHRRPDRGRAGRAGAVGAGRARWRVRLRRSHVRLATGSRDPAHDRHGRLALALGTSQGIRARVTTGESASRTPRGSTLAEERRVQ